MSTNELRKKFLEFFKSKEHILFSSDTLVPDDPTVLFTSAGMNQFKPYFLGEKKDITRAASCQKCLRTGDLEEVGRTSFHHTFFEMLGNFSFGDYFKKETINFAWEFLTKELGMDEKDLWISVYKDDEEAYDIWKDHVGILENKITKLGEDKNFWPASAPSLGPNGPCGPCSEIFFDKGKDKGCGKDDCGPACDCGRFVEIWNLVFTQFNRVGKNKLEPLPQNNIDTGMGLERMASVLQGKDSNFEIDILNPVVDFVKKVLSIEDVTKYTEGLVNAIVDHSRAASFSIGDGVYPSNEGRGYVVRKIIRRAIWSAHLLGNKSTFLYKLTDLYAEIMKDSYPADAYYEIRRKKGTIAKVIKAEEERFLLTLKEGEEHLLREIEELKRQKQSMIGAQELFRLYDTYGFPLELSKDIAKSNDMGVDEEGFRGFLREQQERSRKKSMFDENIFKEGRIHFKGVTEFVGYEYARNQARVVKIFSSADDNVSEENNKDMLSEGEEGLIILDKTSFYPEGGGQLTDKGFIEAFDGKFEVNKVFRMGETIIHKGKVIKGKICREDVKAVVDTERRNSLRRAHTATHLLQAALRGVLGEHVAQQGSLVGEDRVRFDFTHFKSLTREELREIEDRVNLLILKDEKVCKEIVSLKEAKKLGALAFFQEKYNEDKVRLVSIGDYSKELCGGIHLDYTSQTGSFEVVYESSISSGIRRIEAVVGKCAYQLSKEAKMKLLDLSILLKCNPKNIKNVIMKTLEESMKDKEKIAFYEKKSVLTIANRIISADIKNAKGINFLIYDFSGQKEQNMNFSSLLILSDIIRQKAGSIFMFLSALDSGKNKFICAVTDDLAKKGFTCRKFVELFKDKLGLKGGGKETLIQGVIDKEQGGFRDNVEDCLSKFLSQ